MTTGGSQRLHELTRRLLDWRLAATLLLATMLSVLLLSATAFAQSATTENPKPGSMGVEGVIPSEAPTRGATITSPRTGQSFTRNPITVTGLCPTGLLVKIFTNNVFVGSVQCVNGSYSIQIDLFSGRNDLVARVFDNLDQPGPDSEIVTVTFNDPQFSQLGGTQLSLTSNYAKRGANPGDILTWPIIISGGTPPYALSVDWGDGKTQDLISKGEAGTIDLQHIYDNAGTYTITIKASDRNGQSAFLQVVGVANGAVTQQQGDDDKKQKIITRVLWEPAALLLPMLAVSFWLGRRYELAAIRKHLERD
jgi:hypothetical protein